MKSSNIKAIIKKRLFETIAYFEPESITLVGSLFDREDLVGISDIDTVVIVKELNYSLFEKIVTQVAQLNGRDMGLPTHQVLVNSTFGPLKFDAPDTIVIHLMIYDIQGHKDHVLASPFTCYDWERSKNYWGKSLAMIYPVLKLQPSDFFSARRGIDDYLRDLKSGQISYREYVPGPGDSVILKHMEKPLDERHCGEFAVHIVRFLIANAIKLLTKSNTVAPKSEFYRQWATHFPDLEDFIPTFKGLYKTKLDKTFEFPSHTVDSVRRFVSRFEKALQAKFNDSSDTLYFFRHAKTPLNDGSFLGQRRDPGLSEAISISQSAVIVEKVYSSPSRRAIETAEKLFPATSVSTSELLLEIDYGEAEGLTFKELTKTCPRIAEGWQRGDDPVFPEGENTQAVKERLEAFLSQVNSSPVAVVSHNVVLRCLIGILFNVPIKFWYKLPVEHVELLKVLKYNGHLYADFPCSVKERITDALVFS